MLALLFTTLTACGLPPGTSERPDAGATLSMPAATSLDGQAIQVPDPGGRTVVLELIRSADW